MTIGIYKMEFSDGSVYIGQSNNCERRRGEHVDSMEKHLHPNRKVRAAYRQFGTPTWRILEECALEDLNSREVHYISTYNSFKNGLNLNAGGGVARPSTKKVRKASNPSWTEPDKRHAAFANAIDAANIANNKKTDHSIVKFIVIGFVTIIVAYFCTM